METTQNDSNETTTVMFELDTKLFEKLAEYLASRDTSMQEIIELLVKQNDK